MTVRVVRDIFNEDFSKVIVSGDEAWETIHGYVAHVAPDLADRLSRWTSEVDVFATYRIDEQLMKALDRKVWLPSGGSLVIDKTEAMVVVDVNTGKFTGQGGNLEETVTRNNLEAAEEIVRQLRLRDLGGIVVIDFIDMVLESNRDLVLRRLLECLGRDRTKHQVAEVTSLGLVQMTRKRVGQGLLESFSETCVHCNGRGVIVHMEQPTTVGGGGNGKRRRSAAVAAPASSPRPRARARARGDVEAEVRDRGRGGRRGRRAGRAARARVRAGRGAVQQRRRGRGRPRSRGRRPSARDPQGDRPRPAPRATAGPSPSPAVVAEPEPVEPSPSPSRRGRAGGRRLEEAAQGPYAPSGDPQGDRSGGLAGRGRRPVEAPLPVAGRRLPPRPWWSRPRWPRPRPRRRPPRRVPGAG